MRRFHWLVEVRKGSKKRWQVSSGRRTEALAHIEADRLRRFAERWKNPYTYRVVKAEIVPVLVEWVV